MCSASKVHSETMEEVFVGIILLIDFGSTYTKIRAVDLEREEIIGSSQAPSTADTDMMVGLQAAYGRLLLQAGISDMDVDKKLACSSAAGGLRIVAIGLVPELTTKAAIQAAFGAGGKIVASYSYSLSLKEAKELMQKSPDLVLLAGGTDGGNTEVILHNARIIAESNLACPIVIAGNKVVAEEVEQIIKASSKYVVVADNIMPEVNQLKIEPTQQAIRKVFMDRIVKGKGLNKAEDFVGDIIMPTPMAVLNAASLLAGGTQQEEGWNDLVVIDVGGATTDVDSVAKGSSTSAGTIQKGLPDPYAMRTVEGDLGIRYSASYILEMVGIEQLLKYISMVVEELPCKMEEEIKSRINYRSEHIEFVGQNMEESLVDFALSCAAVELATKRHAGTIENFHTPSGTIYLQRGKDLTGVRTVIGTGGIFCYGNYSRLILDRSRHDKNYPLSLRPNNPEFFLDESYILYAAGLLAQIAPQKAFKIMKKYLKKI